MTAVNTVTYKTVSLISGIIGGVLAGVAFTQLWRAIANEDEAPAPTALDRDTRVVLAVAALQGAVFGLFKALMGRATAMGYRRLTGTSPGG
ncbi:MAG: DUF4235 domain-containing protein [Pseudonocardiaceae bacterium]